MRWLIATDDFPPLDGGVATWTAHIARGLCDAGDEVAVLARARPGLGAAADGQPFAFPVIGLRGPSFGRHGGFYAGVAAWWHLRAGDSVLATTWNMATGLVRRCRGLDVPLHVVFHGSDLTRPPRDPKAFDRVCAGATRRWAVSRWLAERLAERGHRAEVLCAPVDAGPPRASPVAPRRWIFVGRATPLKGGDRFVRYVAEAGATGVVVGDGPELPRWRALAAELGADVTFTGTLPLAEVRRRVAEADVAVLVPRADRDGSGAEGFGLALVEAAARGVAVVGCRTGGVPEATGAGLVLDDPDDVAAAVAAIRAWWTPERGEACRRHVAAHHGVARVVERLRTA